MERVKQEKSVDMVGAPVVTASGSLVQGEGARDIVQAGFVVARLEKLLP